jgi:hypothetical protein
MAARAKTSKRESDITVRSDGSVVGVITIRASKAGVLYVNGRYCRDMSKDRAYVGGLYEATAVQVSEIIKAILK